MSLRLRVGRRAAFGVLWQRVLFFFVVRPCSFAVQPFAQLVPLLTRWHRLGFFWVVPMLDDNKHTEAVKMWLTEREFMDLSRMAGHTDRKPSEFARVVLRRYMYGNMGACGDVINGTNRADEGLSE